MTKKKSSGPRSSPEGVKIIGVLYFIGAFVSFVFGSILLSFSDSVRQNAAAISQAGIDIPSPAVMILAGITLLILAVLEYFIARGIFRRNNWARIVVVSVSALGIVGAVINLTKGMFAGGTFSLIVNGLIFWYLLSVSEVKKAFN